MGDVPSPGYAKPFHLFHYNKPKPPPLPKIKLMDYRAEPQVRVRTNFATRMRNKVIKETLDWSAGDDDYQRAKFKKAADSKMAIGDPEHVPRQTKTSQYRYKWVREVPVVSCRFTEHVIMYKKPPFTFQTTTNDDLCGNYRLRRMKIKSPDSSKVLQDVEDETVFLDSVLQ